MKIEKMIIGHYVEHPDHGRGMVIAQGKGTIEVEFPGLFEPLILSFDEKNNPLLVPEPDNYFPGPGHPWND